MQIINGQDIANSIYQKISLEKNSKAGKRLVIILASSDPASKVYTQMKQRKAAELGISLEVKEFDEHVTTTELQNFIAQTAQDISVGGIMTQLPLFPHLQLTQTGIVNSIPPHLDVDGLTAANLGLLAQNSSQAILPATVKAILKLLEVAVGLNNLAGMHLLTINHSALIGKPLAQALLNLNATVTVAHEATKDLPALIRQADIVISATGQVGMLTASMFKDGAGLIDVTSVKVGNEVKGDYNEASELELSAIGKPLPLAWRTSVPGGVGPVTIACLLENFIEGINFQRRG